MSKFKVGDKVRVLDGSNIKNYTANWCAGAMNKYVGKVYEVAAIYAQYEKNKVAYELKGCGWYKFDERGLEPANKFKVGDKVIGNEKANCYTITKEGWIGTVKSVGDNWISVAGEGIYSTVGVLSEYFDLYGDPKTQKIVITTDGKTTTAVLYDGKKRIKDAKAECAPSDKFNFGVGAALAVERLMGKSEEKSEFLNARIYITNSGDNLSFEAGKVYEIKDGRFINEGVSEFPYNGNIKNLDDLKYYFSPDSERNKLKHSAGLSHLCWKGVKYQVLEPLEG